MKKPIIAVFCKGNSPTEEEYKLMLKHAALTVVAYNVSTLSNSDCLIIDGVCGEVPERFKDYPTADEMQQKYAEYLNTLGINVGGQAPEPPLDPPNNDNDDDPPNGTNDNSTDNGRPNFGFNQ